MNKRIREEIDKERGLEEDVETGIHNTTVANNAISRNVASKMK